MPNAGLPIAMRANAKDRDECVPLIEDGTKIPGNILEELRSTPDAAFRMEWVARVFDGMQRLRRAGMEAVA